jgi:hypothetical protein
MFIPPPFFIDFSQCVHIRTREKTKLLEKGPFRYRFNIVYILGTMPTAVGSTYNEQSHSLTTDEKNPDKSASI